MGGEPERGQGWLLPGERRRTGPLVWVVDAWGRHELTRNEFPDLGEIKPSTDAGQPVVLAGWDTPLRSGGAQRGDLHLLEEVIAHHWGGGVGAGLWRLDSFTGRGEVRLWGRRALWAEGTTEDASGLMLSGVTPLVSNAQNGGVGFLLESEGNLHQSSGVLPQDQGSQSDPWVLGYEFVICNPGQAGTSSDLGGQPRELTYEKDIAQRSMHSRCSAFVLLSSLLFYQELSKRQKKAFCACKSLSVQGVHGNHDTWALKAIGGGITSF